MTTAGKIYGKDNKAGRGAKDHNGYVKGIDLRKDFMWPHKTTNSHCVKFVSYCLNCGNATNFVTANVLKTFLTKCVGVFNKQGRE